MLPKIAFERFRDIKKNLSCSLKLKNFPALDYPNILETTTFKEVGVIKHGQ